MRSRRTSAGMGRSRRQSPGRALGRRQRRRWRAGGVRRGGVGGGGENPSWAIVSIKKRQSVPGRWLSALELLLGKERGGKKEKEGKKNERGGKAGGRISGLVVLKASLNVNLSPKPGDACVYIEAGGCAVGAPPAPPPPPRRAHKAGGVVRGRRPERVSARRRPPRPGRPPPAPAVRPGPTCSRRRIKLSSPLASSSFSLASR